MDAFPFGVGEPRLFRGKRDDLRFGVILRRSFSPEGRSRSSACLFAAGGNCLVRPRLHTDHPSRKSLSSTDPAIASTSLLTSGTVSGIKPGSRSPLYRLFPPHGRRGG